MRACHLQRRILPESISKPTERNGRSRWAAVACVLRSCAQPHSKLPKFGKHGDAESRRIPVECAKKFYFILPATCHTRSSAAQHVHVRTITRSMFTFLLVTVHGTPLPVAMMRRRLMSSVMRFKQAMTLHIMVCFSITWVARLLLRFVLSIGLRKRGMISIQLVNS